MHDDVDVDRIERRLQAWEDRPASTYGDISRQISQQEDDIRVLIAEVRRLRVIADVGYDPAKWRITFTDPHQDAAIIPPIEPAVEPGWSDWGWVRRLLRLR